MRTHSTGLIDRSQILVQPSEQPVAMYLLSGLKQMSSIGYPQYIEYVILLLIL